MARGMDLDDVAKVVCYDAPTYIKVCAGCASCPFYCTSLTRASQYLLCAHSRRI